jgi:PAS domain S-box-containing protein
MVPPALHRAPGTPRTAKTPRPVTGLEVGNHQRVDSRSAEPAPDPEPLVTRGQLAILRRDETRLVGGARDAEGMVVPLRAETEQALRESEARYRRITEGLTDYQYTVRVADGRAVETTQSPACASVTGYTAEEHAANPYLWIQLVTPEDRDRVREHARRILAGEAVPAIEHRIVRKDGAVRWVSDAAIPHKDASGRLLSYDGVVSDITDRKRAEAEKAELEARDRQLQKAESLSRMAGAIAHHFNNQLQTVLMSLELAMGDLLPDAGPAKRVTGAMMAANRAVEMSKLMLTYLGQTPGARESLDLSVACGRWLSLLELALPKHVVLETDLASPGPTIRANAEQMREVLTHLVTNAWEAGGADRGEAQVTVKVVTAADVSLAHRVPPDWQPLEPAYACLEVVDHGSGIAEADLEKIFDPFFSTKFTGRGLGLAVVLGIVRSHGGAVTVESIPGGGSAFRVYLPLAE